MRKVRSTAGLGVISPPQFEHPVCQAQASDSELLAAIQFHLDGLREDGLAPPPAESVVEYMFVPAQPLAPGDAPQAARP